MLGIIEPEDRLAGDTPYWNPKTETLGRERLEALQLAKLRRQCEWAAARSPWYQRKFAEAGFEPASLQTISDLRRAPMLTRDDWMSSQDVRPPYGEIPAIGGDGAIRVHTTSGTTGRGPLRALDSRKDWAWIAEMWCYALWGCGVRPTDTAYIAFGYGSFIGFWGLHYAMEKMGVLNVPGGAQPTEARVQADPRLRRDRGRLDPDVRAAPRPGGPDPGARPARLGRAAADPVGRAGGFDSPDQGADRGAVGSEGLRHRRHDRDRHDHGVRVLAPAGRHPHHRGQHDRGGHRPSDARAGGLRGARRAGRDVVRARRDPADPLSHRRPRLQGARFTVRVRPRL